MPISDELRSVIDSASIRGGESPVLRMAGLVSEADGVSPRSSAAYSAATAPRAAKRPLTGRLLQRFRALWGSQATRFMVSFAITATLLALFRPDAVMQSADTRDDAGQGRGVRYSSVVILSLAVAMILTFGLPAAHQT